MKGATVRIFWTPSVSSDVKSQNVVVKSSEELICDEDLPVSQSEILVDLNEKANVEVTVSVSDGTFTSDASMSFVVPDLTKPMPVTGLGWEVVDVFDPEDYEENIEEEEL